MVVEVQDLTYTYTSADQPAVSGLRFAIQRGEIFGFLGPSGAGKSTTQKVLIRLLRDYQGSIQVMGADLSAWGSDFYERIGVSFEVPTHYLKLSGLENLTYFGSLYEGPCRQPNALLEMVGLQDDGDMLVSRYSKGMKNRLSVARSLLNDPELLFLDEPTTGLDPVNARRIKDLIRAEQTAGKTIFLTTHNMTVADELCDRVAFIVDGRIALIDSPRNLKLEYGQPSVRVEYAVDGRTEHQEFPMEGLADNQGFLNVLRRHPIQTIHSQEATLENIFIQVTGKRLV